MSEIEYSHKVVLKLLLAELFKTLGDENRIRILNLLLKGELCVCELEVLLGISQSNASRHLNKLKSLGIISSSKNAQWVYYKVDEQFVIQYPLLHQFLQEELIKNQKCAVDTQKLVKYKESPYTCVQLGEIQPEVMAFLAEDR